MKHLRLLFALGQVQGVQVSMSNRDLPDRPSLCVVTIQVDDLKDIQVLVASDVQVTMSGDLPNSPLTLPSLLYSPCSTPRRSGAPPPRFPASPSTQTGEPPCCSRPPGLPGVNIMRMACGVLLIRVKQSCLKTS